MSAKVKRVYVDNSVVSGMLDDHMPERVEKTRCNMTKLDLSQIKPIPGFDSLKCKRNSHTKIRRETEGMTGEEVLEYFRKRAERFDAEIDRRRAELATENLT